MSLTEKQIAMRSASPFCSVCACQLALQPRRVNGRWLTVLPMQSKLPWIASLASCMFLQKSFHPCYWFNFEKVNLIYDKAMFKHFVFCLFLSEMPQLISESNLGENVRIGVNAGTVSCLIKTHSTVKIWPLILLSHATRCTEKHLLPTYWALFSPSFVILLTNSWRNAVLNKWI